MAPAIEGWLLKRGHAGQAKRRFFVLLGPVLAYYRGQAPEEKQVPRGQLVLGPESRVIKVPGRRGFVVSTAQKIWTMTSELNDAQEVSCWHDAIANAIARCRETAASAAAASAQQQDVMADSTYVATVSGTEFVLDRRYESVRPLGHGAYGVVVSATDLQTGARVAIKKCPSVFEDPLDAKRIAREIRLLRHFRHPNIIKITDLMVPAVADFSDVYMVAELMDTDLHRVIYSGQKLSEEHVQFFLYQLLCGIKHIHSANVIHRDLKPSNVLLNENCDLKICDFGLARDMGADKPGSELPSNLTEYVVTRWYRAPEVMLTSQMYSKAIDIWGAGCIFGEMLGRKPLFPGNDYIHQLKLITKLLGTPSADELSWVQNPKARAFMLQLPPSPPQELAQRFPRAGPEALDLLGQMLRLDYRQRARVDAALAHPYFASVRDPVMEFPCPSPVPWGDIERCPLTRPNLQRIVLEDVAAFHPAQARPLLDHHLATAAAAAAATVAPDALVCGTTGVGSSSMALPESPQEGEEQRKLGLGLPFTTYEERQPQHLSSLPSTPNKAHSIVEEREAAGVDAGGYTSGSGLANMMMVGEEELR